MNVATVLLVLALGLATAQLNFEGNPLTENTEYTAEESRLLQRTARQEQTAANVTINGAEDSQKLHPPLEDVKNASEEFEARNFPIDDSSTQQKEVVHSVNPAGRTNEAVQTARYLSATAYNQGSNVNPAEVALSTFLNSKTPEESRQSLDSYLQNSGASQNVVEQPNQQMVSLTNQPQLEQSHTPPVNQQSLALSSPVNQHLTAQLMQQRQVQAFPVNQQQYGQMYNLPQMSTALGAPLPQQQMPYGAGIQSKNDVFYPPGWHHRVRRIRGKPYPLVQSRVGPGFYNGPVPVPFKQKAPVEIIYTKPPGFHHGPPPISNAPVPYEDASPWFPEADHPPPSKDVYYSQLYAQSYDPNYYNYIAKTGKIKPYLYGKLGKRHEDESSGIWTELYRGFKKHGLKNIMTPTFLLGMTLPVVTLMLTALVQKRSLGRSASWEVLREEKIQEYLEQVQRAIECYEKRRRKRDASVDDC
ncbi:uncharacterized protein LOC143186151 [Calliopsis andreniformis]|uniref:uncharacterized protein LOC143186151 n=1 Tax=Calliopsis andreniformis TaxID=337506 RepID=UPI003FCDD95F